MRRKKRQGQHKFIRISENELIPVGEGEECLLLATLERMKIVSHTLPEFLWVSINIR